MNKSRVMNDLRELHKAGWTITIYEGVFRKRRFVAEITATKTGGNGELCGVSYMSCEHRQKYMQRWADELIRTGLAIVQK